MAPERRSLEMTREFLIGLAMFAPALWGQTAARAEFEVASVKVNLSGDGGADWNPEHGNFTAENATLRQLIMFAYHLPGSMISGPGWLDSVRFDIHAKGKGDAPDSQVELMMQSLLAGRFHLKVHRETKEGPVYFLTVMSGGLKAQRADTPHPTPFSELPEPHPMMRDSHVSMAELAGALTDLIRRPVFDRTGIEGEYRVMVWWGNKLQADAPDLFTALQEQVGLKLESGRGPVETLVVDAADKVPVEN
jgi:uncharacterized protein (TIGR03435 family)